MNSEYTLNRINEAAAHLWRMYNSKKIWAFHGNLGSGKTTLINALCKFLKVENTVTSPTFSIINEYLSREYGIIYHIDLYRLISEEEAINVGVEECILSKNYCFIEWPEKAPGLLPPDVLHLFIDALNNDKRKLTVSVEKN